MARQTTLNRDNGWAPKGILDGIGELGDDLITLASLQAQLAQEDLREATARSWPGLAAIAISIPIAISSVTAVLFGGAYWMAAAGLISLGPALLLVGVIGLIVAVILGTIAFARLRASASSFVRSREEFERNVAWLGTVVRQSLR
jgi:lambda repressor-like predicted transcriptional regulator